MHKYDSLAVTGMLEQFHCNYEILRTGISVNVSEKTVADAFSLDAGSVFKTLVLRGESRKLYAFLVPADKEPDMEKLKRAAREEELFPLDKNKHKWHTGYSPESVTPIAMKCACPTYIDKSARDFEKICLSAGEAGTLVRISLDHLLRVKYLRYADLIK